MEDDIVEMRGLRFRKTSKLLVETADGRVFVANATALFSDTDSIRPCLSTGGKA